MGANCPGCNPPRTCASLLMSTSEASVSPAGSVGPGRSPLGTRTQRRELPGVQPPRTCAILLHRRKRSLPPIGANCPGCNPRELSCAAMRHVCLGDNPRRARAPAVRTGVSAAHRPQARIESPSTGPRTCADGPMSTSEASCHGRELSRAATRRELPGAQPPAPVTYLVLSCKKEKKGGKPRCSRKAFPGDGW